MITTIVEELKSDNIAIKNKAMSKLYVLMFNKLKNKARKSYFKHSDTISEDMASDTIITSISKIHLYNSEIGTFDQWIFTILKNNCLQKIKKLKNHTLYSDFSFLNDNDDNSNYYLDRIAKPLNIEDKLILELDYDIETNDMEQLNYQNSLKVIEENYDKCLTNERLLVFELKLDGYNLSDIRDILNTNYYNKINGTEITIDEYLNLNTKDKYSTNSIKILYSRAKDDVIKYIDYTTCTNQELTFSKYKNIILDVETRILSLRKNDKLTLEHIYQCLIDDDSKEYFNILLEHNNISRLNCDKYTLEKFPDFLELLEYCSDNILKYGTKEYIKTIEAFELFSDQDKLEYYKLNTKSNTKINWAINRDKLKYKSEDTYENISYGWNYNDFYYPKEETKTYKDVQIN